MTTQKEQDQKTHNILNAGVAGASAETVQRFGSAVKEHMVAYSGTDNENGVKLAKGLRDIAKSKINPDYQNQNIKQQAGFSAEVKTQARENAEKIIHGKANHRTTRTDDMKKQPDGNGRTIGGKNEQLYDIAEVNSDGSYIKGTGRQLKYVGGDAENCYKKLLEKKYDKYREADVPIEIPSDFYEDVKKRLNEEIGVLEKQIEDAEKKGNTAAAAKLREKLERAKNTKNNLRKGKLTSKEAIEARTHPVLSTAKDVAKVSHRAGLEAAGYGAAIGGSVSIVQNLVAVIKDEKEPDEALLDVAKNTASAAAVGYGTGFTGAALKGFMQNASSESFRNLSKTNLPATVVSVTMSAAKTLQRYFEGEITGVECFEELGEQGTGMLSSSLFAAIGQAVVPIPVVGGMIGGMFGYALASASYGTLLNALKDADLAHEERLQIEKECEQQIDLIQRYRKEMEELIQRYLSSNMAVFQDSFTGIKEALAIGDVDGFIGSANQITQVLGKEVLFHDIQELDQLMDSALPIRL